ncbi:SPOR domain-containing protein [Sphingomonas sp. PAMC 26621]|uniref:SPOR domain-containing protein n=1 Tax=Sphingomonas sp. PAMC 26621 TaxID=1112213 RepID=UPI0011111F96|nr:SPOR domain-containing protein [Sphingomonas sp. PAMC 26621]
MMKTRPAISFGPVTLALSVMLLGGSIGAVATSSIADASAREQSRAEKQARREIGKARGALSHRQFAEAISHAEMAVTFEPNAADYRMTLAQGYLKAGRFQSARDAFGDALMLDPTNGKAALQFALMQVATGDWASARATLDSHATIIPVNDRGLALALAGDPVAAVEVLGTAARSPGADAKTRQNLALALALAGRWREAQVVVAIDVAPAEVAHRLLEWSTFSRPTSASDQVSALLGIMPVADRGQPQAIALSRAAAPMTEVAAAVAPIETAQPVEVAEQQPAAPERTPVVVAAVDPVGPTIGGVVFAPHSEVVQTVPTRRDARATTPVTMARIAALRPALAHTAKRPAKGGFYVQLGAYDSPAVARDAWIRAARRFAGLAGQVPQGAGIAAGGANFYRLSVGGFVREDAVAMCRDYRARGGNCFVRAGAGDQVAMWAKGRELASR